MKRTRKYGYEVVYSPVDSNGDYGWYSEIWDRKGQEVYVTELHKTAKGAEIEVQEWVQNH